VEECAIEMTISMSHPAVSLLIFHKHTSHLRVDLMQISGDKLFSPWDFEYLIYARGQIAGQESAIASSCSARLDPPVAHAEGTNTGRCKRGRCCSTAVVVRIDDLTLQDTVTAAPVSTCAGFKNSILSRRAIGLMAIAVNDLRVYSLSDASMFDM
jgi:hypothetical protein